MAVIELEVLYGRGGWEGSKGNLTGYTYKESATPLAGGDSSGATPSFTVGVSEDDDYDGTFALLESRVALNDQDTGTSIGIVRTISATDGAAGLEIESILSLLNAELNVGPYYGTFAGAIDFYMSIAGILPTEYSVDPTIATQTVTFPGWNGSVWDKLKEMCVANQIEVAGVNGRVIFRPVRKILGNDERNMSVTFEVNNTQVAKAIEIYYYENTYKPVGLFYPVSGRVSNLPDTAKQVPAQNFQVEAGEVVQSSISINAYIMDIAQPVAVSAVDQYLVTTASVYTVIDKDSQIVDPGLWMGTGGSVTAAAGTKPDELIITVTGAALDSRAPFRIAMPIPPATEEDSIETYPSLRIAGEGVFFNKQKFIIPTGADPKLAVEEIGVTIDNPFISTIDQVSTAGVLAAKNWSGRDKSLRVKATSVANIGINGSIVYYSYGSFEADNAGKTYGDFQTEWAGKTYADFVDYAQKKGADDNLVQAFGNVVGARVPYRNSVYRIRDVGYSEEGLQYTAESDTLAKDFQETFAGVTYGEFAAMKPGRTYNDFALAPLWRGETSVAPLVGYGLAPYGIYGYGDDAGSTGPVGPTPGYGLSPYGNNSYGD